MTHPTLEQIACEHLMGYRTVQGERTCQTCALPWAAVEEVNQLREQIEYAPRIPFAVAHSLAGWVTPQGVFVCASCAGRIMERGFRLPLLSFAVWKGEQHDDAVCALLGHHLQ